MKNFKRLILFGDSYTYGHSLPDCFIPPVGPGLKPSKLGYGNRLADKLNIPTVLNYAMPGASNKLIQHRIISFNNFTEDDLVIVQFSFKERTFYFNKDANSRMVGSWSLDINDKEMLTEEWEYFLRRSSHEMLYDSYLSILGALTFLESKPCILHCMCCDDIQTVYGHLVNENNKHITEGIDASNLYQDEFIKNTIDKVISKMTLQQEFFDFWEYCKVENDLALDNRHPGVNSHIYLAELILLKITNQKFSLPKNSLI